MIKNFKLSYIFFITKRFLLPAPKSFARQINMVAFFTILLSCFLSFLILGFVNYIQFQIENSFVLKDFHINFTLDKRSQKNWNLNKDSFTKQFPIKGEYLYTTQQAILIKDEQKQPLYMMAIENHYMKDMPIYFKEGSYNSTIPSIIITKPLAESLNIHLDDIITVVLKSHKSDSKDPSPLNLQVTGIIEPSSSNQNIMSFIPLSFYLKYFDYKLSLKKGIILKDTQPLNQASYKLGQIIGAPVQNYQSSNSNLLYSIRWEKICFLFILGLVIIISFSIIYLGFGVIIEKSKKTLITLRILGVSYKQMRIIFFYKALMLGFLGSFIALFSIYFFYTDLIPAILHWIYLLQGEMPLINYNHFIDSKPLFHYSELFTILTLECLALFFAIFHPTYKMKETPLYEVLKND